MSSASHLETLDTALSSIHASPPLIALLRSLHTLALTEPAYISTDAQPASSALDRFVALEPDKCAFVYLLLRATGARFVVEAGTSFGLSTIYLALAVGQNVIATENEPTKALRAREHWDKAGEEISKWIELREGDLRETLKADLPEQIDFLLLDIWATLALPTLKLVQPRLKIGATIVADNITSAATDYADLLAYMQDPKNGFRCTTAPYAGGLYIAVYVGQS
ncbi:O-methyltransferase protein [Mycena chlorophos]|uniref:O-methyltransferase protein n=1 Tax=Mycena chlorophos TaxID=658473 RepID=A0A8H6WI63_MYCCL|nr:O-methyltransferase protein [Mycena chlorophos]